MKTHLFTTVSEAKDFIDQNKDKGCTCPVCSQKAKVWKISLISTACRDLIKLVRIYNQTGQPVHISKFTQQRSNFYTLKHWNLIEPVINEDTKKRASGLWLPTAKGIAFVTKYISIPKYALVCNNKLLNLEGEKVNIVKALRNHFDYEKLMNDN